MPVGIIWAGFGAGGGRKLAQERAGELRKVGVEMGGRGFRRGTGATSGSDTQKGRQITKVLCKGNQRGLWPEPAQMESGRRGSDWRAEIG